MRKIVLGVLVAAALMSCNAEAAVGLRTFFKENYPAEDTVLTGIEPNILFFLDTSSSTTMASWGELPTVLTPINAANDSIMIQTMPLMRDADERANMFKDCTYGAGSLPASSSSKTPQQSTAERLATGGLRPDVGTARAGNYTRWGRDLRSDNNIIGDPDCYYTSDPDKPYLLTFKNADWGNWPKSKWDAKTYPEGFPSELQKYLPGGSQAGKAVPASLTDYLVPNDSKMYQMKLALWRILDEENAIMLSKMRVAVMGNFFDYIPAGNTGALHRRPPYSAYPDKKYRTWHMGQWEQKKFQYGTGPEAYSGIKPSNSESGDYQDTETIHAGVSTTYSTGSVETVRHASRGYLRVPFDYMYTLDKLGAVKTTQSLVAFRELIDGVEQYNFDKDQRYTTNFAVNEELLSGGTTQLAVPIYGRGESGASPTNSYVHSAGGTNLDVLGSRKAIDYAKGATGVREAFAGAVSDRWLLMKRLKNSEGLMTGTALGSAIDFFSPFSSLSFTGANEADDTRGYFPVTGSCQANWLIIFTGGNEKEIPGKSAPESLLNLYKNSQKMRGRMWNGTKWIEKTFAMDQPIRTLIVGLVSPDANGSDGDPYVKDQPNDTGEKRLRKALTRMARAGNPKVLPGGAIVPNQDSVPYFANNVPELVRTLQTILVKISTEHFAAGAPIALPLYDGGQGDTVVFSAFYTIRTLKQWDGSFHKYLLPADATQPMKLLWKAEELMANQASQRKVYTPSAKKSVNSTAVKELRAYTNADFSSLAAIPLKHADDFRNWLLSYSGENAVLGEIEHSGLTIVGDPSIQGMSPRSKRIYLQTNRGLLHALDYETGVEAWGFIPPNIFQERISGQKFDQKGLWYSGDGETSIRSRPLVLLDGLLSAHDVRIGTQARTVLIGNMGWGGNGFYAMDVTKADAQPQFMWAIDNARYAAVEKKPQDGVKLWGAAGGGNVYANYDYSDLGLTIAAAEIRTTRTGDVGIMPGGLGYQYGGDSQGKVFYVFNPENGAILRKFNQNSGFSTPVVGRQLGMATIPISYFRDAARLNTVEFYTADSQGNVLYCGNMSDDVKDWKLESVFQLLSVGGSDPYTHAALTPNIPIAITRALEAGKQNGERWVFGGTSDLPVPDFSTLRKFTNNQQFIFALNTAKAPTTATTDNLFSLKYMQTTLESVPNYGAKITDGESTAPASAVGWYLRLRPKITDNSFPTDPEYVTTSPFLYGGVLYVSTFIPRTRNPNDIDKCPELGDSKIYAFDPTTGKGKWKEGQALLIKNVKISGISALNNRIFYGVKELKSGSLEQMKQYNAFENLGIYAERTVVEGIPAVPISDSDLSGPYNVPRLQYWREVF